MAGLNQVQLIGYLGKDPEIRRLNSGDPVVNLRLATSESWRDKNTGERQEKTEWHNVVIFNKGLCGIAEQYLHKGSQVFVQGKLQTRKWQDQSGAERYSTEVVLTNFDGKLTLLGKADGAARSEERPSGGGGAARTAPRQTLAEELDDDIPFLTSEGMW